MPEELFVIENPCGCEVMLLTGKKPSPTGIDFMTKYRDPGTTGRWRTPKHEHVAADILLKSFSYPGALDDLVRYFREILQHHEPAWQYPIPSQVGTVNPRLRKQLVDKIKGKHLFHTEDLLQVYELIVWQEITRYPDGTLSWRILDYISRGDLFAAVGLATRKQ
jgi:hypothetical protein